MGMNIGAKNYDDPFYQQQLAHLNIVILGFYKGWRPKYGMAQVVQHLKTLSQNRILVGQYTILNECEADGDAEADVRAKLNAMNWWARNAAGQQVQWTSDYHAWDINFTAGSQPDAAGQRYSEWLPERDDRVFFRTAPFDLWYCDNVMAHPRVTADWTGSGHDAPPEDLIAATAYRTGHRSEWKQIRKIHPGLLIMGNADCDLSAPEFASQLEGAFLEALMGKKWSLETWAGWQPMMERYHQVIVNTRAPHFVGFNVHGSPTNYRFFRYAFASCLLDDGYFCFTDPQAGYSSVPWFDEYNFALGAALTKPAVTAWTNGVWRRDFSRGVALVNPTAQPVTVTVEPGLRCLRGRQDPAVNHGQPVKVVSLAAKDGIILQRD